MPVATKDLVASQFWKKNEGHREKPWDGEGGGGERKARVLKGNGGSFKLRLTPSGCEVRLRKPACAVEVSGLFAASRVLVGLVLPSSCTPKAFSGLGLCRAGKTYIHGLRCLEGSLANAVHCS